MKEIIIKGCKNCPVIDMNDFCPGWQCHLEEKENNSDPYTIIQNDKKYIPITPDWCPLKKQSILLKLSD